MENDNGYSRRNFLRTAAVGTASFGIVQSLGSPEKACAADEKRYPYKIGIRQASLKNPADPGKRMISDFETFKVARDIPGITGVELQVYNGFPNMWDLEVVREYKRQAHRWGLDIPSTAGTINSRRGVGKWGPSAPYDLRHAIRCTELLGASDMLVAFFRSDAPDMTDESSFGPIVEVLQAVAPAAFDAGVIMGLENSLSPADNKKLVDLVDHPACAVYYDLDNMVSYGHGDQAVVPGIKLLGKKRISAVHVKSKIRKPNPAGRNERGIPIYPELIKNTGRIDWAAAFKELSNIKYDGWFVFETGHESHEDCIETTRRNVEFIKQHFAPSLAG